MGRIAGPWGVRGWVRVHPYSEDPGALADHAVWHLGRESAWRTVKVIEARLQGNMVIAALEGLATREDALALKGSDVAVPREALPEPEEGRYYWADLVGFSVVNTEGIALGQVEGLFSNGAHDVIEVRGEAGQGGKAVQRLVPWTAVMQVDPDARRIEVEWGADW